MHAATIKPQARAGPGSHGFLRHLLEMALAMMVGMIVSAAIFLSAVGMTAAEAMRQHAVLFVVLQAAGMTLAMVAWMRHRGHAWRNSAEMAAAMLIPAVPLVCLRLVDVISGPICGVYCLATIVAMVGLMLYRRSDYGNRAARDRHGIADVGDLNEAAAGGRCAARGEGQAARPARQNLSGAT
jgi:hypothetical protein